MIEANPVAAAVCALMSLRTDWSGTASELLIALAKCTNEAKSKEWPSSPRQLSGKLRRVAPFLRKMGVEIKFGEREGRARNRIIRIAAPGSIRTESSASSALSAQEDDPSPVEEPDSADGG